jgi:predicted nucleic acid-binding Zn ribbon protein
MKIKKDRKCVVCGEAIYQGVLCAECHGKIEEERIRNDTSRVRQRRTKQVGEIQGVLAKGTGR